MCQALVLGGSAGHELSWSRRLSHRARRVRPKPRWQWYEIVGREEQPPWSCGSRAAMLPRVEISTPKFKLRRGRAGCTTPVAAGAFVRRPVGTSSTLATARAGEGRSAAYLQKNFQVAPTSML